MYLFLIVNYQLAHCSRQFRSSWVLFEMFPLCTFNFVSSYVMQRLFTCQLPPPPPPGEEEGRRRTAPLGFLCAPWGRITVYSAKTGYDPSCRQKIRCPKWKQGRGRAGYFLTLSIICVKERHAPRTHTHTQTHTHAHAHTLTFTLTRCVATWRARGERERDGWVRAFVEMEKAGSRCRKELQTDKHV